MFSETFGEEQRADANSGYDPLDNTPEDLKARPQWVVWKFEDHGEPKPAKVLYNPHTGQRAKSNDPQTWATFAEALAAYQHGGFDGIGFVFTANDPYVGIDLDSCRDPASGRLEPWAGEIVERLDGYTEASPSGTGVHIIVEGKLPAGGRKKGQVEMYDSGRFFTVTGQHLARLLLWIRPHTD
jgi:putative DNA primase/helicase